MSSSKQYQRIYDHDLESGLAPGAGTGHTRNRSGSGSHPFGEDDGVLDNLVDLKQINARLSEWFAKIKLKQGGAHASRKDFDKFAEEIHSSVFTPTYSQVISDEEHLARRAITRAGFEDIVESVRQAIRADIQPRLVTKGSSGSYFALNKRGKVVGIFKPKNEEPYGQLNPKWTKWLHRNLFPCFFGRSCLIPNLSYISEAGAYLLDQQLRANIVPPTGVVWFASPSFNYDYFDRRAHWTKGKPLPPKQGSFQVFLDGFKDATEFLKEHPWPDASQRPATQSAQRQSWASCVGAGAAATGSDDASDGSGGNAGDQQDELDRLNEQITTGGTATTTAFWSEELMQSMREELEKLVILDYIMRNTDRGLDNWMLKVVPCGPDGKSSKVQIVAAGAGLDSRSTSTSHLGATVDQEPQRASSMSQTQTPPSESTSASYHASDTDMQLGAIDNSLAFPWKHPDEWRSFPFGWLFLPASLIGKPFSQRTRQHFLPLLTDPRWWRQTTSKLKELFSQDADYQERMFAKQMAVLKGQAWNVVETLKSSDQGPLELARRPRLHVWTDIMEVPVTVGGATPSRKQAATAQGPYDPVNPMPQPSAPGTAHPTPSKSVVRHGKGKKKAAPPSVLFDGDEIDLGVVGDEDLGNGQVRPTATDPFADKHAIANADDDDVVDNLPHARSRPPAFARSRTSNDFPDRPRSSADRSRSRGLSLSNLGPNAQYSGELSGTGANGNFNEESDLGDLGYGLARTQETSTRRVVVERLETVHGAEAVFSWC
ncbi:Phosphatidylinositol 4-kinase LSB6 [Savitreella phatthalungensis]